MVTAITLPFSFQQLNYQYLKKCVEIGPITPMQKEWAEHILTMIPEKLQQSPPLKEVINELFCEIRDDYTGSMKKSMGKSICVYTGQQPNLTKYKNVANVYKSSHHKQILDNLLLIFGDETS